MRWSWSSAGDAAGRRAGCIPVMRTSRPPGAAASAARRRRVDKGAGSRLPPPARGATIDRRRLQRRTAGHSNDFRRVSFVARTCRGFSGVAMRKRRRVSARAEVARYASRRKQNSTFIHTPTVFLSRIRDHRMQRSGSASAGSQDTDLVSCHVLIFTFWTSCS